MSSVRFPRAALLAASLATVSLIAFAPSPAALAAPASAVVDIPYETFTLANGLRVIVHTDRKAPIVAVNLWYHVGSKDEPSGRSGFAHLFEHLMFSGSENAPGEFFAPLEQAGASDMNGTTSADRTNYFETVPTTALDMALWMESDRMGHLLGAIDQQTLNEQRGVVQNEKRERENEPYGQLDEVVAHTMYPKGHPYYHSLIGSMNDLDAASLDDVKTWFRTWYGPNNSVLVLAGDIDLATAREKVTKYFGDIPATPTMAQPKVDIAVLKQSGHTELEDNVPQVLIERDWNVPPVGTIDSNLLNLASEVLGGSVSSRLDARAVHRDGLVDSIVSTNRAAQLGGQFSVIARVKQGVDPAQVEAVIEQELQRLIEHGPTAEELARTKTRYRAEFVRGIEAVDSKAGALAGCATFTGNPGCLGDVQARIAAATPEQVRTVAAKWLGNPSHTFVVKPGTRTPLVEEPSVTPAPLTIPRPDPKYTTTAVTVDRKMGIPQVSHYPPLMFPALQRARLNNGSEVVLAERHEIPVVELSYKFDGGYASDHGGKLGVAAFATAMLSEGAGAMGALALSERAEDLGAGLSAEASLDGASVSLSALKENLDASVELFTMMLRQPRFEPAEIERVKAQWIADIAQEKASPQSAALRVLPLLLYGNGHPYAIPFTGSSTEDAIASITREDLLAYQRKWLRPERATVIVVGDTTLAEIVPLLNRHLGDWKGEDAVMERVEIPQVKRPTQPRVFLIDQPGAVQANIYAGELVSSIKHPDFLKLGLSNEVLGGAFTSRLNMNLREDKHWSYGASTQLMAMHGQSLFAAVASVQIDKTAQSVQEIRREIGDFATGKVPATQAEVDKVVASELRGQLSGVETAGAVMDTLDTIVSYGHPDNWIELYNQQVTAFTPAQAAAAAKHIDPQALTWVIVGDLSKIEQPVRSLNLGEVTVVDADGKPVVPVAK